jgi:hypothetical protein
MEFLLPSICGRRPVRTRGGALRNPASDVMGEYDDE